MATAYAHGSFATDAPGVFTAEIPYSYQASKSTMEDATSAYVEEKGIKAIFEVFTVIYII